MSAKEQIQLQVEQEIEPKLEQLLAQKIKPHAIRKKEKEETVFRKERNVKKNPSNIHSKKQFKTVPEVQGKPEDTASSLFKFAKEKFGVELRLEDDRKEAATTKPSGKGSSFRGGRGRGGYGNRGGKPRGAGFGKNPKREWNPEAVFQPGFQGSAQRESFRNRFTGSSGSPDFRRRKQEEQQQQHQERQQHQKWEKKRWDPKYHR